MINKKEWFKGDTLAKEVFVGKYSLDGKESPDEMHKRLAREFARIEHGYNKTIDNMDVLNRLSKYGKERYVLHKSYNSLEDFEARVYKLFKHFACIIPGGSVMQGLGSNKPVSLSNCLQGDTKVLTRYGYIPIRELADKEVEIMTKGGGWVKAPFKSYGKQKLVKIILTKGKTSTKEIYCTLDHNWFKNIEPTLVSTGNLIKGDKLHNQYGKSWNSIIPSPIGIAHGICYGDGNTNNNINNSNSIDLCGNKRLLGKYFANCYISSDEVSCEGGSDHYSYIPNSYRRLPDIKENKSYLLGWLLGYIATDGCVDERGSIMLNSSIKENLLFVQDICGILGIHCGEIHKQESISNLTNNINTIYKVFISSYFLKEEWILLPEHKKRFKKSIKRPSMWTVQDVCITDIEEEVYCAEVPNTYSFVIEGNILSGNCFVIQPPDDDIESIMNTARDAAQIYKRRGGVGFDISKLRPRGASVSNSANTSTGSVSFMELFSRITETICQEGRRGALMLSIDVNHPDVTEFATIKRDLSKVTGANISIRLNENFLRSVREDKDYLLSYPCEVGEYYTELLENEIDIPYNTLFPMLGSQGETIYFKKVKAKELWDTIIESAWLSAEPGIFNWDRMIDYDPSGVYPELAPVSTNPCQPGWATVLTPDGIRQFKDIYVGDTIWTKDGWSTIIKKDSSGVKDVYEFRTTGGSFYGTEEHKIVSNGEKIQVKDATRIDLLAGKCNSLNGGSFIAMVDGLVIGDGSVHKASNNLIYLCIGENDQDYFKSEIAEFIGKHRPALKEYAYEIETTIRPEELPLTFLRTIPDRYFYGSSIEVRDFLRGLYSANGSVVDNRVTLKTSSPKLRDQVQIMLSSIGIRSYYTTNKSKDVLFKNGNYNCKESYDINISTDRDIFYNTVGFIQKYKMDKLKKIIDNNNPSEKNHVIISKEKISTEEVFNITVDNESHTYWTGGLNVSNCGELGLAAYDSCRLIAVNLYGLIKEPFTHHASLDLQNAYAVFYEAQCLADSLIDLEIEAIDRILTKICPKYAWWLKQNEGGSLDKLSIWELDEIAGLTEEFKLWFGIREKALLGRRTGTGITGYADMLAALGRAYGDYAYTELLFHTKLEAELDASIDMSILRGKFPAWNDKEAEYIDPDWKKGPLCTNKWYKFVKDNYPEQYFRMQQYGRRNVGLSTIAPTGSLSILTQTTSGIEPLFLPYYTRRKKCNSGETPDFIDNNGVGFKEFIVVHPKFKDWYNVFCKGENGAIFDTIDWTLEGLNDVFKESPWYGQTANDISSEVRVETQALIQRYITSSISSTVNLPKEATKEQISKLYSDAFDKGCKGITVYRDGSRSGILNAVDSTNNNGFKYSPAFKRPKVIQGHAYTTRVAGKPYTVIIGLIDEKPYEVFIFDGCTPESKGIIKKKGKGVYEYEYEDKVINIALLSNDEQATITRYISMSLRHGADIKYVVEQLRKNESFITSFTAGIARVLSKYITKTEAVCPDCGGKIIKEGGCEKCQDCGSSKCGMICGEFI